MAQVERWVKAQPFVTSTEHFGTELEVPVYLLVSVVCQPSVCDCQVSVHI